MSLWVLVTLTACSSPHRNKTITIAAPVTAWTWPLYIAKEAGYYRDRDLDVRFVEANHPSGIAMLLSGDADANLLPLQRAIEIGRRDPSYVAIGTPISRWLFALVGSPKSETIRDLKGGRLAVSQLGDATHLYGLDLLRRANLKNKDVEVVVVGPTGRIPAVVSGRADATMVSAPAYFKLIKEGYRVLANLIDAKDVPASNVLLLRRKTVEDNPQLLRVLAESHALAVERFYKDRDLAIRAYVKYDPRSAEGLDQVYDEYVRARALEPVPYVTSDDVNYFAETEPQAAGLAGIEAIHAMIRNDVFDHMERDGFLAKTVSAETTAHIRTIATRAYR